ncbi:MAG: hypothetical protein HZB76_06530 [Chlamydiae bacterium]|nr:hypothetical protein [Chlamydiota bacterium]
MKNLIKNKLLLVGALAFLCACQPDKKDEPKSEKCCSSMSEEKAPVVAQETATELQSQPATLEEPVSDEVSVQNEVPAPEVLQAMPQTQMSEVSVTPASEEVKVEEVPSEVSQSTETAPAAQ